MSKFITLSNATDNSELLVNADAITYVVECGEFRTIHFIGGEQFNVNETMESLKNA